MTKKPIIIIGSVFAVLLITVLGGYIQFTQFNKIPQIIRTTKGNDTDGSNVWDYLTKDGYKTVICKKDLLNPINVTITDSSKKSGGIYTFYTNLTRANIFSDFKTNDYQASDGSTKFTETSVDKVATWYEQKGCDFFKKEGEIEGSRFSYNLPITPAQIEKAIKDKQQDEQIKKDQETFKNSPAQEKIKTLENEIKRGNGFIDAFNRGEKTYENQKLDQELIDIVKQQIKTREEQIATLKKENGLE